MLLTECVSLFEGANAPRIDRANGVIHGVKILGKDSLNDGGNRVYSDQSMDDACKLYEGLGVNLDHPAQHESARDRQFHEGIGQLRGVEKKGDGVYGDLHVLKEHPHAGMLFEAAERMPSRFGLSHNAEGDVRRDPSGKNIVTNLKKVRSVDVVHRPATNVSLFESQQKPTPGARTVKTIKIKSLIEKHPKLKPVLELSYRNGLLEAASCMPPAFQKKVAEDDDGGQGGAMEDADVPDSDDSDDDSDSSGGMSSFVMSLLQMVVKLLGKTQVQERLIKESKFGPDAVQGQALEMPAGEYPQVGPGTGGAKGTGAAPKQGPTYQESLREALAPITNELKSLRGELLAQKALTESEKAHKECLALFESLNREPHAIVLKAALALKGDERRQLIESQPEKVRQTARLFARPEVSRPLIETHGDTASAVTIPTGNDFAAELFRGGPTRRVSN